MSCTKEIYNKYKNVVISNNDNDIQLYQFVLDTIWKNQIEEYGLNKLAFDLNQEFNLRQQTYYENLSSNVKTMLNRTYRNVLYKPLIHLRYKYKE